METENLEKEQERAARDFEGLTKKAVKYLSS